jgi:hypothetical protein
MAKHTAKDQSVSRAAQQEKRQASARKPHATAIKKQPAASGHPTPRQRREGLKPDELNATNDK